VAMTSTIGLWFCAMDFAFKATIRLLFIVPLLASTGAYAGEIEGEASAIDGDSLNMQIRLFAIDTPEADQTCKDHEGRGYLVVESRAMRWRGSLGTKSSPVRSRPVIAMGAQSASATQMMLI
jgi:endonuclease YncB( thermonuclease family)